MASESVHPLRIQKNNNSTSSLPKPSPTKMAKALSEISPMGIRRNSPSFNHLTKQKSATGGDSSPFDASPENRSPRSFWKTRESVSPTRVGGTENMPLQSQPSQTRRSSIERLQKASRVKNSNIFARASENGFDADSSILSDRSFATGRPLSGNAWVSKSSSHNNSAQNSPSKGHRRSESTTQIPILSPSKSVQSPNSPSKLGTSPTKSSLSSSSRFAEALAFNHDTSIWSEDDERGGGTPKGTLRHPKSVSFDAGPPQINEYEEITPDPSSVASGSREGSYEDDEDEFDIDLSFERGSSEGHEDSFDHSLEDTEKTPVVLPEDWRFMSPEVANTELADTFDDPFDGHEDSSRPTPRRGSAKEADAFLSRSLSVTSDSEPRPLPPLPTSRSLEEEVSEEQRSHQLVQPHKSSLPSPRPASISKDDVLKMQDTSMPLEERLQRLSMQKHENLTEKAEGSENEELDESTITFERSTEEHSVINHDQLTSLALTRSNSESQSPREPSLRRMKSQLFDESEIEKYANLDPDIPIPSREASSNYEDEEENDDAQQRDHPTKQVADMYSMHEAQSDSQKSSPFEDDYGQELSVIHHDIPIYEDEDIVGEGTPAMTQKNSTQSSEHISPIRDGHADDENDPPPMDLTTSSIEEQKPERNVSLLEFTNFSEKDTFGVGLESYMTPSPPISQKNTPDGHVSKVEGHLSDNECLQDQVSTLESRNETSSQGTIDDVGTPESVIFNPLLDAASPPTPEEDTAFIPHPKATIKAPGSQLKTRASATTAELESLHDEEIHTSSEAPPAIPDQYREKLSLNDANKTEGFEDDPTASDVKSKPGRRQSMRMKLDLPLGSSVEDMGFGMDKEFDRLLEAQKRGYLMRQNTKVVVATNRNVSGEKPVPPVPTDAKVAPVVPNSKHTTAAERETRSAGNSPRKPSGPTVTTEPWNGKMRRHSTRKSMISPEKPMTGGRVSLAMQQQNSVLDTFPEDHQSFLEPDAGAERGRFFVKVTGVKNLDLPLPRNERTHFQLTLDNGLHCVMTSWLELGRNAQIGQEFELTVFDELDFSLTLQTKLERPVSQASTTSQASSVESPKKKESKQFALSRLLASPKKKREAERRQQEEQAELARQRQREIEAERASKQPTAWDLLHNLVGPDGSFARAILSLDDYEEKAFGRPITTDVPCFNNWAVEDSFSSTKSKHGGVQRKPPYQIGSLTLQLLYIPKPRGVADVEMPQSMSACVKQLKEAEANSTRQFEGHLSQQGGDCPYWRRRFFKLNGSILTAYHEATRQRRANIRLAKATKLIDDRSALVQSETSNKGGKGRRRSAFATDTEGYMFVEEGFRICFANGDTIDFYADTRGQKEEWMDNLSHVIGKDFSVDKPTWTAAVLAYERMNGKKPAATSQQPGPTAPTLRSPPQTKLSPLKSNPASPTKKSRPISTYDMPPPPIDKSPRHSLQASPHKAKATGKPAPEPSPRTNGSANSGRRKAVRSMIF